MDEAQTEFTDLLRLRPDHVPARVNLGLALAKQQRFDEAEMHFREVVRLDPANQRAHQSLDLITRLRLQNTE